ncbi:hypothetical protein SK128_012294, partial [Halocaridina rubra]
MGVVEETIENNWSPLRSPPWYSNSPNYHHLSRHYPLPISDSYRPFMNDTFWVLRSTHEHAKAFISNFKGRSKKNSYCSS